MMPWSEAVRLTGEAQPHTYDIVHAGMTHAAAIIVIFSPDDLARVKDDFSEMDDPDRTPQGQARQNVTLEAGMAFAMAPKRTIFVKSQATREISDIAGFNWVKLNGEYDSRADLKNRLEIAGADLRPQSENLMDPRAGNFRV
jgi:predicted nucleotide-binding protein